MEQNIEHLFVCADFIVMFYLYENVLLIVECGLNRLYIIIFFILRYSLFYSYNECTDFNIMNCWYYNSIYSYKVSLSWDSICCSIWEITKSNYIDYHTVTLKINCETQRQRAKFHFPDIKITYISQRLHNHCNNYSNKL